jgi:histidine phosphotransferase ChpT
LIRELKFAELLCTRLCHDLTGPIGAIANGAEFLSDEGFDMQKQAIELINSSAAQAVSRLQFYRKAYGRINDDGEANLAEQKKVTENFFADSKVTLDWPDRHTDAAGISVSYKMGRLLLNMVIIASATLLRGGTLGVRIVAENNHKEIRISANGVSIKWDKEIEDALAGRIELMSLTPKTVQADLTRWLAQELSAALSWEVNETGVELVVRQPVVAEQA